MITGRHSDSNVSSLDNPVFESDTGESCRQNMHTQAPRSILKKTPSAVHGNVRASEADQEMKQSNVAFARRLTYSQEHEQGEMTRDLRSMAMSIGDDDFGLIDQSDRHSQGSVQYRREESFGQDDSVNLVQIERVGSGRVQPPSFLNSTDRGIGDLDRRLETLLTSGSEILEKSREMMNRTSVADLVKDESMTSAKAVSTYMGDNRTIDKDRIEHEKNRRMSHSQERNRMQSTRMDSDRRLQEFSAQKERQELPKLDVSDRVKRADRAMNTSDRVKSRYDSNEGMDSYTESNGSRSAIDAIDLQVEQLMRLRQRLDESKKSSVQTEPLDLRKPVSANDMKVSRESLHQLDARMDLPPYNRYSVFQKEGMNDLRYRENIERPTGDPPKRQILGQEAVRNLETQREYDTTGGRQSYKSNYYTRPVEQKYIDPVKGDRNNQIDINYETEGTGIRDLRETTERKYPSDEQSDAMKEERLLLESRKRKEALLKERERILVENKRKLREREVQLENNDQERRTLTDRYDQLLQEKEKDIEKRRKEYKERKAHIEQRELQLVDEVENRRQNLIKVERGLQKKEHEFDTTEQRNLVDSRVKNVSSEKDQFITSEGTTSVEARDNIARNTVISESTNTDSISQYMPFSFPKITVFSGEEPRPKSESSFEEWTYEVRCLRKDKMYSEATIGQAIRKSLKGQAKKVLLPMGSDATVDQIIQRLGGVFGNVATPMSILQEFYTVYQKQDETVASWGLRLEEILQRAIDKGHVRLADRDVLLRDKF